jgi:hypothetical protein
LNYIMIRAANESPLSSHGATKGLESLKLSPSIPHGITKLTDKKFNNLRYDK